MFVTPSSFTLNSTGTTSGTSHPFPDSLPLSTLPVPPPNQSLTPPSSRTPCPSFSRSSWPPHSLTMPPPGAIGYPHYVNLVEIVDPLSLSSPSILSTADSPEPTTNTDSRGTSLPLSSAFSSNPGVSASLTPSPSWTNLLSSSQSLSANPTSLSDFMSTSPVAQTSSSSPVSSYSPHPTSSPFSSPSTSQFSTPFSPSATTEKPPDSTTTIVTTAFITSVGPHSSSPPTSPSTSTYTIISILLGQGGATTDLLTSSVVLSTEPPGNVLDSTLHISPGTIAAIVLGIVGAFAFAALWLFCARRRHRKLVQETTFDPSVTHAPGPLEDEILGELGYGIGDTHGSETLASQTSPTTEERYAGILAALHLTEKLERGDEGGSTGGVYGSRHDITTVVDGDGDDDITRASSPTLPPHSLLSDDPSYPVLLSPPPSVSLSYHPTTQPTLPPSAYYMSSRRKSSPGPDAATLLSGYSVTPSYSSHYARSQTLGSGSASGSVDALTRTRTGSEEPLLGIGKVTSEISPGASTPGGVSPTVTDPGSNKLGLGSAFGSPAASMYSPSSIYPTLQHDSSGSYDVRTASRTGSYGYARSGTSSSFDILRSVSSQGALSNAYSHGQKPNQGFNLGLSRPGSSSSAGSIGKKAGSGRHSFGVPSTSFRAWKDRGSIASDKEKQSLKEKDGREKTRSPTSASNSESMDEKQGRGSPVVGVRALLGRLRLGGLTSSPHSSNKDLSSPTQTSVDADPEKAVAGRLTPPPIEIQVATPQRRRFSFILSNPDPHPPSPYSGAGNVVTSMDPSSHEELLPVHERTPTYGPYESKRVSFGSGVPQPVMAFPTDRLLGFPSPAPTEESRLAEDLLHPRLRTQGNSDASLRDFEDYSRPIGGVVKNRLYSTTTFGTQDDAETRSRGPGTPVQDVAPGDAHENEDDVVDVFGATTPTGISRDSLSFNDQPQSHHSP